MPDSESRFTRKGEPVLCPFCKNPVPRPSPLEAPPGSPSSSLLAATQGGRCSCGAIFLLDASGREGGQLLLEGLARICDGDLDRAMALSGGVDYQVRSLGYSPRGHNAEPIRRGGFGRPKLWFFLLGSVA